MPSTYSCKVNLLPLETFGQSKEDMYITPTNSVLSVEEKKKRYSYECHLLFLECFIRLCSNIRRIINLLHIGTINIKVEKED